MAVAVVVPWRGGCPYRERALTWVLERYRLNHPDWEVVLGQHNDGPWVKAQAIEAGMARTSADVLIMADGDVWCDGLGAAVEILEAGAHWVMPHLTVHRFSEAGTERIYAGENPAAIAEYAEAPYHGWVGGGLVVFRRESWGVAPMDHRFEGWSLEDASWGMALTELVGPHVRLGWPLWHLWHPPQPRMSRRVGNRQSEALWRRYRAARGHPGRMADLVAEGRR